MSKLGLRSVIGDVTPPILFRPAQLLCRWGHGLGFHTFAGCYPTLQDVPCGTDRYDDSELAMQIVEQGVGAPAKPSLKTADDYGRLILPIVVAQALPKRVTVIDFGGGVCTGLRFIKAHCATLDLTDLSYVLVETPALCAALRSRISEPLVTVTEDIPTSVDGAAIVSACSSLQYVSDWRSALKRLAALMPEAFIVSLTPFTDDGPTYARQQMNIPHKRIAAWLFNRVEFTSTMEQLGYRAVFAVNHDVSITHKGAPGTSNPASILFRFTG